MRALLPDGRPLAERVEDASTFLGRLCGWMLRRPPGPGEAILLRPCNAVHTCFMRFPIDILFLDADCRPLPGLLAAHAAEGARRPHAAILGRVDFPPAVPSCVDLAFDTAGWFRDLADGADLDFVKFITANLSVPAAPLRDAGGFSESFTGWGYEDLELGYRLERDHDVRVTYRAAAAVVHEGSRPLDEWLARYREKGENALRFLLAHPHARERLAFEVDAVLARFDDPDFFPGEPMLADMRDSCEELEATGAWRDNARFRDMLVEFYRNLARHAERAAIRRALARVLRPVTVVLAAKHSLRAALRAFGSVLACRYPEELVRVLVYDPGRIPGLADFFSTYRPPVALEYVSGDESTLREAIRAGDDGGGIVLFLDDTLRASRGSLLGAALAHAGGLEKVRGTILPDTPLGRYLAERRLFVADAAVCTKNLHVSFTRRALDKPEGELATGDCTDLVALREVPGFLSRFVTDPLRFYRLALAHRGAPRRTGSLIRLLAGAPKALLDTLRLKARGHPLDDALLHPLFDRLHHYVRFVKG